MNNELIYNAVLAGISGSTQNLRQGVSRVADYTSYADRAAVLALAVDALIAPAAITDAEAQMMGQIVAGIDLQRCFVGKTPAYATIATDILAMWNEFKGRITPSSALFTVTVDTIAALRLLPFLAPMVFVKRYDIAGTEEGGGWFELVAGNLTADNGVTWFVSIAGGHYYRVGAGRIIYTEWAGIDPNNNGTVDMTAKLKNSISALGASGGEVILTGAALISEEIIIPYPNPVNLTGIGTTNVLFLTAPSRIIKAPGMVTPAITVTCPGVKLSNFAVLGQKNGAIFLDAGDGINIQATNVTVEHVSVFQCGRDGFRIGADTHVNNCNDATLIDCVSTANQRDGFRTCDNILPVNGLPDCNACIFIRPMTQANLGHGIHENNARVNTYIAPLCEANNGYGIFLENETQGTYFFGGDPEANVAGDFYQDPTCFDNRIAIPMFEMWKNLPITVATANVLNGCRFTLTAAAPIMIKAITGCAGQRVTFRLNTNTSIQSNAVLRLAGQVDVTEQSSNSMIELEKVGGVWFEISRNFPVQVGPLLDYPISDLSNVGWTKTGSTATAGRITASAGAGAHGVSQATSLTIHRPARFIVFLGVGTSNRVILTIGTGTVDVSLNTLTINSAVGCTATVADMSGGYAQVTILVPDPADTTVAINITDVAGNINFVAAGTETINVISTRVYQP